MFLRVRFSPTSLPFGWRARPRFEHNRPCARPLASLLLMLALFGNGCASDGTPGEAGSRVGGRPTALQSELWVGLEQGLGEIPPPEDPAALRILLSFGEEADLDLYITDPLQETVYFANSPSGSGGRLFEDLRCGAPAPRVEAVHFSNPLSGRYRIGVDFPESCGKQTRSVEESAFVIQVDCPHGVAEDPFLQRRGWLQRGRFEVIVVEFDLALGGAGCVLHSATRLAVDE